MHKKSFVVGIFTGIGVVSLLALLYLLGREAIERFSDFTNINRIGLSTATPTTQSLESIAEQWNIIPIRVQNESEGSGWVLVTVDLAIENNSNRWGSLYIPRDILAKVTLETAEGFIYGADTELWSGSYVNTGGYGVGPLLPPGFRARGDEGDFSGLSRLCFHVAEKTTGYKITIPQYFVEVYSPQTDEHKKVEVDTPVILNLDSDTRKVNFPTDLSGDNFTDFNSTFDFEGIGTVVVNTPTIKYNTNSWTLTLNLAFRNASAGYEQWISALIWTIGKKGICYELESLPLSAGPNQSGTGTLDLEFPLDESNLKLFIRFHTANSIFEPIIFDAGILKP